MAARLLSPPSSNEMRPRGSVFELSDLKQAFGQRDRVLLEGQSPQPSVGDQLLGSVGVRPRARRTGEPAANTLPSHGGPQADVASHPKQIARAGQARPFAAGPSSAAPI